MAKKSSKGRTSAKRGAREAKAPAKKAGGPSPEALRQFIRARADGFLKDENITSVGIGRVGDELGIQFTVATKAAPEALEALGTEKVPDYFEIDGHRVKTDVIQRRYAKSYTVIAQAETLKGPRKERIDPIMPGVSVSHPSGTAGTLGAIVYDRRSGAPCVLSNWHVLNTPQGDIGDAMVQPGPFDDNHVDGNAAGTLIRSHLGAAGDCAIAKIEGRNFDPVVLDLDVRISRIGTPELDDVVVKSGRTTAVTYGRVRRVDVMTKIDYGEPTGLRNIGGFEIGPLEGASPDDEISMGGDSGSVWLAAERRSGNLVPTDVMLGLHFAGETQGQADEHAVACYATSVFEKLEVVLEPPPPPDPADPQAVGGLGYDRDFVGKRVALPTLSGAKANDVVRLGAKTAIPYTHFSVCLSAERKLAHFVAWNIDGEQLKAYSRTGLTFKKDPRLDADDQIGDELYADNKLDRGHIARRADLVWGPKAEAQRANKDSFIFTNITPQHQRFNQSERGGLWGELENAILDEVNVERARLALFGGPILKGSDPVYRHVRIPRSFWKLIAWADADTGELAVKAYVLTQNDLLNDIEAFELDPFRLYQVGLDVLSARIGLDFSAALAAADTFAHPEGIAPEDLPRQRVREVLSRSDLSKRRSTACQLSATRRAAAAVGGSEGRTAMEGMRAACERQWFHWPWAGAIALSMLVCNCGGSGEGDENESSRGDAGARMHADAGEQRTDSGANADASDAVHPGHDAGTPTEDASTAGGSRKDAGSAHTDAGSDMKPLFPDDEDADGDGVDNGTELALGTDPRYLDTDMDGISDDIEIGADPGSPEDSDDDDVIDALENAQFDNDRDGMFDDVDKADGWQIVYGRFVPAVLANDGGEPVRFELKLARPDGISDVAIGMSSMYHRSEWAPDELEVDGTALGDDKVELFDDGTHGDVLAGDGVWSRGGITTHMAIRSDRGVVTGKRCRVLFNEVSVTTADGDTDLPFGTTDGTTPSVIPDFGFWLPVVLADLLEDTKVVKGVGQRTSHVLNIVDAALLLRLEQLMMIGPTQSQQEIQTEHEDAFAVSSRALAVFDADFDFIYAFAAERVYTPFAGFYLGLSNDVHGIGDNVNPVPSASGSAGRLRGVLSFGLATEFPLNHETMHSWGAYLQPALGTDDHHWGIAGTNGVLGGFDPATLVDHGDGTFTVASFFDSGNDWHTTAYSPIELYLMGLVPATDVAPIPVFDNASGVSSDATTVTFSATKRTVTIGDITAAQGARVPAVADSRKTFDALFLMVSDRKLGRAELALINHIAAEYELPTNADFKSFADATGGRATITTKLPALP